MQPKIIPDKEVLTELYFGQLMSHRRIALLYGVKPHVVIKWFHDYGVALRSRLEAITSHSTKVKRVCKVCSREFLVSPYKVKPRQAIYCSVECRVKGIRKLEVYHCEYCDREFQSTPNVRRSGKDRFCSMECRYTAAKKGLYRPCLKCGHRYYVELCKLETSKYCSMACRNSDKNYQKRRARAAMAHQSPPTKPERLLSEIIVRHHLPYAYTGDGSFVINNLNPDFVNTNGEKKVIEVFGDYWHGVAANRLLDTVEGRQKALAKFGFQMLVLWEHEILKDTEQSLLERIKSFTGDIDHWQLGLPQELKKACKK